MSQMTSITFGQIAAAEPRIRHLLQEALRYQQLQADTFCANACWYGYGGYPGIKPQLERLVGWKRPGNDWLCGREVYDVAYAAIYDVLPACRDCACWNIAEYTN